MFRTFETRQYGVDGPAVWTTSPSTARIRSTRDAGSVVPGRHADREAAAAAGRNPPPNPTRQQPGYPLYIPGEVQQKSPRPPWPDRELTAEESVALTDEQYRPPCEVVSLLARGHAAGLRLPARPDRPRTRCVQRAARARGDLHPQPDCAKQQNDSGRRARLDRNTSREVCHDVVVARRRIDYNDHGWHDKHGHLYYLEDEGDPAD